MLLYQCLQLYIQALNLFQIDDSRAARLLHAHVAQQMSCMGVHFVDKTTCTGTLNAWGKMIAKGGMCGSYDHRGKTYAIVHNLYDSFPGMSMSLCSNVHHIVQCCDAPYDERETSRNMVLIST